MNAEVLSGLEMKTVESFDFAGQRALVRVDFNIKVNDQMDIVDDTRIRAALPTIHKILNDGGSAVLMSHMGRPKSGPEGRFSLSCMVEHLADLTGARVHFANDCIGDEAVQKAEALPAGEILLLENTRFYDEETSGDDIFAAKLARLGDVYVNDAFGTAHRAHASTAVIAQFFPYEKRMFGFLMADEIDSANKVLGKADKPFTAIIGGAKVSDKILIIEQLLEKADHIIIGGGMAYTFWKAKGGKIGSSLCEEDRLVLARKLLEKAAAKGVEFHLPSDSKIADSFAADAATDIAPNDYIPDAWMGLDIGPASISHFSKVIAASRTILWNGPMGVFEFDAFKDGTKAVAEAVASATGDGAFSLVGGGDSVAAVKQFKLSEQVSYVSTGGGAMLEYFEGKALPGIVAVEASWKS